MLLKKILASSYSFLNERNTLSYYCYKINAPSLKTKLTL